MTVKIYNIIILLILILLINITIAKKKKKWRGCRQFGKCRKKLKKSGLTPINILFTSVATPQQMDAALDVLRSGPCKSKSLRRLKHLGIIATAFVKDNQCKEWLEKFDDDYYESALSPNSFSPEEKAAADVIEEVEIDGITQIEGSHATSEWSLQMISSASEEKSIYKYPDPGGKGVIVYVLDSGVNFSPEFLWDAGKQSRLRDRFETVHCLESFGDNCDSIDIKSVDDKNGHGTHVAGIVASSNYGVAPYASLVSIRVMSHDSTGSLSWFVTGIDLAVKHCQTENPTRKCVINMSIGGTQSDIWDAAVKQARENGLIVVVAAGNEKFDACSRSPAASKHAITVSAVYKDNYKPTMANYGECVDVFAPGVNINSVDLSGQLTSMKSGTSMAAPHISGIVALSLSQSKVPYNEDKSSSLPSKEYLEELSYIEHCIKEGGVHHAICDAKYPCPNNKIPTNDVYGKLERPQPTTKPTTTRKRRRRRRKKRRKRGGRKRRN